MKNIFEHIEQIKGKPHHIRKRIAFSVATLGSTLVALVWFAGNLAANTFYIQGSSFAMSRGGQVGVVATTSAWGDQGTIAGAAAGVKDTNAPAHIEIVDTTPKPKKGSEPTILPF